MPQFVTIAVSILFDGLAYAMFLFITSVGLSVTMGLMGFVNLAHGAFAMAGGYIVVTLTRTPRRRLRALAGHRLGRRSAWSASRSSACSTAGSIRRPISSRCCSPSGSPSWRSRPSPISTGRSRNPCRCRTGCRATSTSASATFPSYRAFLIVLGAVLIAVLWYGFERTNIGAKIRAAVDNRRMAQVGRHQCRSAVHAHIRVRLGAGRARRRACHSIVRADSPSFAVLYLVLFLIVVAVGGLGSLKGTLLAALVLGIFDTGGKYLLADAGGFFIYAITVAVLLIKPAGFYGRE